MSFKSECDFEDFDEKRADFFYENVIDLWKAYNKSIQYIKRNAVVLLGYLLGTSSLLINLFFNQNAGKYQVSIITCILIHIVISIYITLKVFFPKTRKLPFLAPETLLDKEFNYDNDNKVIALPKLKLKILQDIMDDYINEIMVIEISLGNAFKHSIVSTIIAPFISLFINFYLFFANSVYFSVCFSQIS